MPNWARKDDMGQAKARGTFEQRKAEAVSRNEAAQRERETVEHEAYLRRKEQRAMRAVVDSQSPAIERPLRRGVGLMSIGLALAASSMVRRDA